MQVFGYNLLRFIFGATEHQFVRIAALQRRGIVRLRCVSGAGEANSETRRCFTTLAVIEALEGQKGVWRMTEV